MFNHDKMLAKCLKVITRFAKKHQGEVVYAFAIDSGLLAFNTEEAFAARLEEYQSRYPEKYRKPEEIAVLGLVL